jgi:predicted DNA-binding protein with PD1-like motif
MGASAERRVREVAMLRVSTGASIREALDQWTGSHQVAAALVEGIGAAYEVELGYFDRDRREYVRRVVEGDVEIASLQGNVTLKEGRPFAHLHVVVTGPDGAALGGHLFDARAGATCELVVTVLDRAVGRVYDEATGVWLLDLE